MVVAYSRLDLLTISCIASPPEKDQSRLTGRPQSSHNSYTSDSLLVGRKGRNEGHGNGRWEGIRQKLLNKECRKEQENSQSRY